MRATSFIHSAYVLLLLASPAIANVARAYYQEDPEYPAARLRFVANQVLICMIPVVGLYWVYYRSAQSKSHWLARSLLTCGRLAVVVILFFAATVPILGTGPRYFFAGPRPPMVESQSMFGFGFDPNAQQISTVPETVAGTALSLAIFFGGIWWLRRRRQPASEPNSAVPGVVSTGTPLLVQFGLLAASSTAYADLRPLDDSGNSGPPWGMVLGGVAFSAALFAGALWWDRRRTNHAAAAAGAVAAGHNVDAAPTNAP